MILTVGEIENYFRPILETYKTDEHPNATASVLLAVVNFTLQDRDAVTDSVVKNVIDSLPYSRPISIEGNTHDAA
jgi:hypothetical protein